MGRPVIVTQSPAIKEYYSDIHESLLVPPQDHIAMSNAMRQVASDSRAVTEYGKLNRAWILEPLA
jgi:glycosyltransferase involved in cell wall biosynthesis